MRSRTPACNNYCAAFTLIELVLALAIIGILLALIVPAVQQVRIAAYRVECLNNLKQIGLAFQHYHESRQTLPSGMYFGASTRERWNLSTWMLALTPYIEQNNIYTQAQSDFAAQANPFKPVPHSGVARIMKIYTCPLDDRVDLSQFAPRLKISVGLTSYLGVSGTDSWRGDGVLFRNSRIGFRHITDGLTNTILVGERPASSDNQFGWWYAGNGQLNSGSLDSVLGVLEPNRFLIQTGSVCGAGVYTYQPGQVRDPCSQFHFWSLHSGGAHFLFTDGSVHFLPYSSVNVLPALATRAGSESVTF